MIPVSAKRSALTLATLILLWSAQPGDIAAADNAEKKPAVIVVRLPAEAELFIGGMRSKQQTALREFDTPSLVPGKKFAYALKATWKDGEKEEKFEAIIIVQAGETKEINILDLKAALLPAEKIPAPYVMAEQEKASEAISKREKKPEPKPEPK